MIEVLCEQGTPEWLAARAGACTASKFSVARERMKQNRGSRKVGDPTGECEKYAMLLAIERIAGIALDDTFVTHAMRRGTELEPFARAVYETRTGYIVDTAGIVFTDDRCFGYSTDGKVYGQKGRVEIKCPSASEKVAGIWVDPEPVIAEFLDQCDGGLWITADDWIDLVVYTPWLASVGKELFIHRIYRDEARIEALEQDLTAFWRMTKRYEDALRAPTGKRDDPPWEVAAPLARVAPPPAAPLRTNLFD